jgi:hypothetical protein
MFTCFDIPDMSGAHFLFPGLWSYRLSRAFSFPPTDSPWKISMSGPDFIAKAWMLIPLLDIWSFCIEIWRFPDISWRTGDPRWARTNPRHHFKDVPRKINVFRVGIRPRKGGGTPMEGGGSDWGPVHRLLIHIYIYIYIFTYETSLWLIRSSGVFFGTLWFQIDLTSISHWCRIGFRIDVALVSHRYHIDFPSISPWFHIGFHIEPKEIIPRNNFEPNCSIMWDRRNAKSMFFTYNILRSHAVTRALNRYRTSIQIERCS